jgi:glyoxylase-like metal-dependent hydrolase (beta-lactamase superfamily II)
MGTSLPLDRRAALKIGLGTSIGSLLGLASARAEDPPGNQQPPGTNVNMGPRTDPPPLVDARFPCEIAEDVWVIPDRRIFLVPNIGIVVGKEAALVIDCGLGPVCGQDALKAAERVAPGRRLILTQTHAHPEHAFGAVAFKSRAQIFLNRQQNDYLVRIGPTMLRLFRERYGEQVRQILERTEIAQGTDFYDGERASLDLGERQVEFQAIGTAHSPGDQTIFLLIHRDPDLP